MAPLRDRSILGFLSILLSIVITYILFRLAFSQLQHTDFYTNLFATVVYSFNIAIIFGWMAFGPSGGVFLTVAASILGLWSILRVDIHGDSLIFLSYLVSNFMGYTYSSVDHKLKQSFELKAEKLDEEENIISNNIGEKEKAIVSLEDKLKRYSGLKSVVEKLSLALSVDEISRLMIDSALLTLKKSGRVLLFLVDIEKQELMLWASKDAARFKEKKGDIFDNWVLRHRRSLIIEDISIDFRFPDDEVDEAKKNFRSLIAAPLVSEDKVIGVLRMDSPQEFLYLQEDLRLLDIIADLGAAAIRNARLYSRTQELAIKDGLTGLFVRRYFMERFQEEIKRAARKKGTFSLLLFDIDHFKEYNDRYGHMAGDLVLKYLARMISSSVREVDILARYGGEEIVLLLIGVDKKSAQEEAEAIRKAIEASPLMLRRQKTKLTVSIGVSNYPQDNILEEELIRIADERLYKAKAKGRNRVCAA